MSDEHKITFRNCVFRYKCPESWDGLTKTDDPSVRYCGQCDRGVHFCRTEEELLKAVQANQCVAIPRELSAVEPQDDVHLLLGEMQINYGNE